MKERNKIASGILAALILIIGGFVYPFHYNIADATSGACSWHGGVNCAAGSDWDGSVICNDGWRDSSVSYNSMVMCGGGSGYYNQPPSSYPTIPNCPVMSYYDSLTDSCKCYSGYVVSGGQCVSTDSLCHDQLGYSSRYDSLSGNCKCDYGYLISNGKCVSTDSYCLDKYGYNAHYNILTDNCECTLGYLISGGRCVNGDTFCQSQYGSYTSYDSLSKKCSCDPGYFFHGSQCVTVVISTVYPTEAKVGDEISIKGENFGDDKYGNYNLYVGSTKVYTSDISKWEDEKIVFTVGDYVDSDYIRIKDNNYSIDARGAYIDITRIPEKSIIYLPENNQLTIEYPIPIQSQNQSPPTHKEVTVPKKPAQSKTNSIQAKQIEDKISPAASIVSSISTSIVNKQTESSTKENKATKKDFRQKISSFFSRLFGKK